MRKAVKMYSNGTATYELPLQHFIAKTKSQKRFLKLVEKSDIIISHGSAGTGKTFISLAYALKELIIKGKYDRIILIKPLVEADEKMGFLPGSVDEKMNPFHLSYVYILDQLLGTQKRIELVQEKRIQQIPIAYLRGITFENSIIICDEFQNATSSQFKLVLSRFGHNSKMIITGDTEQSDIRESGLIDAVERLHTINGIELFEFDKEENVRNPLIKKIMERY